MKKESAISKMRFLIMFFVILPVCIFQMQSFASPDLGLVGIEKQWEYYPEDLPSECIDLPRWTKEEQDKVPWRKVDAKEGLSGLDQKTKAVWFKNSIPEGNLQGKCIYFELVYGQSIEVYIDGKIVYEKSRRYLFDINRFIIPLEADSGGKTIYIRTQSIYGKFGPAGKISIGSYNTLYPEFFFEDFFNIPLGLSFVLMGLILFVFALFLLKDRKKEFLILGLIVLILGLMAAIYPTLIILFSNFDQYLTLTFSICLLLLVVFLMYFFLQIFGPGRKNILKKSFYFQATYSVFCIAVYIIDILSGYKIVEFEYFISINLLGIIMVIQFAMLIGTSILYAFKGNADAKIFTAGFSLFALTCGIELILFIIIKDYEFFLWKWGILLFILSLGLILGRRSAINFTKVITYSKELELKNIELDSMWKEIKESRDKLADLNITLEKRVSERTEQLQEANEELSLLNEELIASNNELGSTLETLRETQDYLIKSEKMAALGQLVSGVAHEINTPLGAIQASITNISESLDQVYKSLPEINRFLNEENSPYFFEILNMATQNQVYISSREEREYRRSIIKQLEEYRVEDSEGIAENLVTMGVFDIQAFKGVFRCENYAFIIKVAYLFSSIQKNSHTISIATDKTSKVVFALKSYAHQSEHTQMIEVDITDNIEMTLTLYHNRIKHNVEVIRNYEEVSPILGYPDELNQIWANLIHNALQAMDFKGTLTIDINGKGENVIVSITDSGKGIPDEIKDRIFEPFFTTKPQGEGSGMGLDIVKRIVEKHNGEITVESMPGKTTFTVSIPK